ncbi:lysine histidine transporter-like 8, partial [Olea europaea subsp. europaea]
MEERPETELISIPATPRASTPEILTPSCQRSPRKESSTAKSWTPTSFISPRFLSPIGTPMKRVLTNMKGYLEEVGHLTKLNPQDAWLPITESRNGNAHYAAFHNLNAGVGFQALVLPVAFSFLGWSWGIISLTIAYIWQLYTLWLLVQLHEAVPGKRYNRYVELAEAAFGQKLNEYLFLVSMRDGTGMFARFSPPHGAFFFFCFSIFANILFLLAPRMVFNFSRKLKILIKECNLTFIWISCGWYDKMISVLHTLMRSKIAIFDGSFNKLYLKLLYFMFNSLIDSKLFFSYALTHQCLLNPTMLFSNMFSLTIAKSLKRNFINVNYLHYKVQTKPNHIANMLFAPHLSSTSTNGDQFVTFFKQLCSC